MDGDTDAHDLIRDNPREVFDEIIAAGYTLRFTHKPNTTFMELEVFAFMGNQRVGHAEFSTEPRGAYCQNVVVAVEHQGNRVGSSMYVLAEIVLDATMFNHWANDEDQTDAAKRMWASQRRPFGQRVKPT